VPDTLRTGRCGDLRRPSAEWVTFSNLIAHLGPLLVSIDIKPGSDPIDLLGAVARGTAESRQPLSSLAREPQS